MGVSGLGLGRGLGRGRGRGRGRVSQNARKTVAFANAKRAHLRQISTRKGGTYGNSPKASY